MITKSEDELNIEILEMNKRILKQNEEVIAQNGEMARKEHGKKMELYELQKKIYINDLSKDLEPEALACVEEFHDLFGVPVLDNPTIPSSDRCELRVELLSEELKELSDAIAEKDIVEVADALADLQYVLLGAMLEFGLKYRFKDIFEEVHRSNMSKACKTEDEASRTAAKYIEEGVSCHINRGEDGLFLVYRSSDDKVLKSINYSPANLGPLVQ